MKGALTIMYYLAVVFALIELAVSTFYSYSEENETFEQKFFTSGQEGSLH